jgi:uncharacterized surface protein with fasciclin (FAS1) repeats
MRTPSVPRFVAIIGVGAALTLTAAACSDDSDDSSGDTTETTVAAETTDTQAAETGTIVDLVDTLSGEGPYTVFAPTNDAFDALPEGTLEELTLPENQELLTTILTYHVVSGEVLSTDLTDGQEVETVQGETLTVGVTDTGVTLTDASGNTVNVVTADVEASNGVIHAIDGVLLPTAAG